MAVDVERVAAAGRARGVVQRVLADDERRAVRDDAAVRLLGGERELLQLAGDVHDRRAARLLGGPRDRRGERVVELEGAGAVAANMFIGTH